LYQYRNTMLLHGKLGLVFTFWLIVFGNFCAYAQSQTSARLTGTVRDPQGQVIPQAKILCLASATGESHSAETNEAGEFVLIALSPDAYEVTITTTGFAPSLYHGVSLSAGETISLNPVLQLAQDNTQITVNDALPLIQAENSELDVTLSVSSLTALPLSSRNSLQLLSVTPGASTALTNNSVLGRNSPEVSINGARVTQNHYQINGVDADNVSMHDLGDVAVPAPESIGELKVQSSLYDASVSGSGGSSIEVITKSGSNALHGSAYGYLRNEAFDANDPNLKAVGISRPVDRQNVWGAAIGGPIRKDRLFYFASYQGMHAKNGAASDSLYSNVMIDPCLMDDRSAATLQANCFANQSDKPAIDPVSLALLNFKLPNGKYLIPTPQKDGLVSGTALSTFQEEQFNANVDFRLGANDLLAAKTFFAKAPLFSALGTSAFDSGSSFPGFGTHIDVSNFLLSLREVHSLSSSTVNEVRFGYNYIYRSELPDEPLRDSSLGIQRVNAAEFPGLPMIYLGRNAGTASIGSNELTLKNASPSISFIELLSMQRGRHSLRIGGEIKRLFWRIDSANAASYGEIDFGSFQDFLTGSTAFSFLGTGQTQADFRTMDYQFFVQDDWKITPKLTLNLGLRYELDLPPSDTHGRIGGFDPGLYQPRMEVDENGFPVGPPAQGIIMAGNAASSIQLEGVTRVGNRILKSVDPYDFGPRVGIAWSPSDSGRLAARAGYGIYYSRPSFLYLGLNFASPPFYQASTFFGAPFADPFPDAPPSSAFPRIQAGLPLSSPWSFLDRNNRNPYFQQFNASLQYQITGDMVLQVAYVGSRGVRLYRQLSIDQARIASTTHPIVNSVTGEVITSNSNDNAALRAPLQGVDPGNFSLNQSTGQSTYHSLQLSINRRFSHGLQFAGAYTFSKSMDNTTGAGGGSTSSGTLDTGNGIDTSFALGNQLDPRANRAVSDFDRTHRFTMTFVWDLNPPKSWNGSRMLRNAFGGWQVSGFVTTMSGLPIDIYDPAGGSLYGQILGSRPNWVTGANRSTAMNRVPPGYYFNPLSFNEAVVAPGTAIPSAHDPTAFATDFGTDYGNVGRNVLRGPPQTNLDLSVMKNFRLRERKILEFRTDFFNALNHASRSNPVSDISAAKLDPATGLVIDPGNFGRILGSDSSPRIIQLSVKFTF
jgi:hypothetical protein